MEIVHVYAAWAGILLGFIAGAAIGLFFHKENWLGGYNSWSRRMARLGHISFFGIAFINLAYATSLSVFNFTVSGPFPSYLLIAGAITMPLVCFLSAWKKPFRHLFFLPVCCLLTGAVMIIKGGLL